MIDARPDQRHLAVKVMMLPRDTNPYGTIFGGVILAHIDEAGFIGAHHEIWLAGWPDQSLVTVAMNRVELRRPVLVGDIVSFWTDLVRVGQTSITMHVTVEADRHGEIVQLTEAEVTYVAVSAVGDERRPVPIRGTAQAQPAEIAEQARESGDLA